MAGLSRTLAVGLLLIAANSVARAQESTLRPFNFAVIGDTPYYPHEEVYLKGLLKSLAREPLEFVVHVGDIKSGSSRCDDALYASRRELFASSPRPFVLVPGDNDWSDCDRSAGGGYDPVERLAVLRRVFFQGGFSLGMQVMQVERQSADPAHADYAEHARWTVGTVVFLTLNIIGGTNRYGSGEAAAREARERTRAVSAWLRAGFERARDLEAPGIVIFFHGDPHLEIAPGNPRRRGYEAFLTEVATEARRFGKPVLLIHGDRHLYKTDQPWKEGALALPNVTRVSTFGSPYVNWVRVRVDSSGKDLFRIEPEYGSLDPSPLQ
ncbi:MAG: hypothetical protein ABW205_13920 [Burkholderiales bacterium]